MEHTVASLRDQLQEARGGSDGDDGGGDNGGGGSDDKSECMLSTNTREDQYEVREKGGRVHPSYIVRSIHTYILSADFAGLPVVFARPAACKMAPWRRTTTGRRTDRADVVW